MNGPDRLLIGLVNYHSEADALRCLRSVRAYINCDFALAVVDNSGTWLSEPQLPKVHLLAGDGNCGYAGGVNLLLEHARARAFDRLWLLNPDCELLDAESTAIFLTESQAIAAPVAGSTMLRPDGRVWFAGGRIDLATGRIWHEGYGSQYVPPLTAKWSSTDWISGGHMLINLHAVPSNESFNEEFFLYLEELEWQVRCEIAPQLLNLAVVRHSAGSTTGRLGPLEWFFRARNHRLLGFQVGRGSRRVAARWLITWIIEFIAVPLRRGELPGVLASLRGFRAQRMGGKDALARYLRTQGIRLD